MFEIPKLKKKKFIFIAVFFLTILLLGSILIHFGYNLSFYNSDPKIQLIFLLFSETGNDIFYITVLSLIYLSFDKKYSRFVFTQLVIQWFFNSAIKDVFQDPRPPTNYVNGVPIEESYGFPSGHAQLGVGFWGFQMYALQDHPKRKLLFPILSLFLILVPISRLVLGVHDLDDIIGGFLIGILIATLYAYFAPEIIIAFQSKPWKWRMIMGLIGAMILFFVSILFCFFILGSETAVENIAQPCGLLVSLPLAFQVEEHLVKYEIGRNNQKTNIIFGFMGVVIIFVFYFLFKQLFSLIMIPYWITRFIRYVLVGCTIALFAPFILKSIQLKLKIEGKQKI